MSASIDKDELSKQIGKVLKWWRKKELTEIYYPLDEIMLTIDIQINSLLDRLEAQAESMKETRILNAPEVQAVPISAIHQLRQELLKENK